MDKIVIVPFVASDMERIDIREEQKELRDAADFGYQSLTVYGQALKHLTYKDYAYTALGEKGIYAVGGIIQMWEGSYEVWSMFSVHTNRAGLSLAKAIKKGINKIKKGRLQAYVDVDFTEAIRFIEWLGFEREATLKQYGLGGKDNYIYARIC